MAALDLTMILKLNDKASRQMRNFNRTLDKTKKKLQEIVKLEGKIGKGTSSGGRSSGASGATAGGAGLAVGGAGLAALITMQKLLTRLSGTSQIFLGIFARLNNAIQKGVPINKGWRLTATEITNDIKKWRGELEGVVNEVDKNSKTLNKNSKAVNKNANALDRLKNKLPKTGLGFNKMTGFVLALGLALKTVFTSVITTGKEFEKIRATLSAVIPTGDNVGEAFAFIQSVTKKLPATLKEVSTSFIRMQALGLNPTEEKLLSFGNTAAASGKSVLQFVEAVADAIVGENERLKEFGIKAKVEGDKVAFTFKGLTDVVDNNAAAIQKYLVSIGSDLPSEFKNAGVFVGAATKQMDTLAGKTSNAGVAIDELADNIFQSLNPFLKAAVGLFTSLIETINDTIFSFRKFVIFFAAGLDRSVSAIAFYAKSLVTFGDAQDKLDADRVRFEANSNAVVEQMIAEIDALQNIDEAAKKYGKTLDERAEKQDKVSKGLTITGRHTQTLAEFMQELENSVIDASVAEENLFNAQEELNRMFQQGELDAFEFNERLEKLNELMELEPPTDDFQEFFNVLSEGASSDLEQVFGDAMLGKVSSFKDAINNLGTSFVQTINRMVAKWLAAKVITGGFGLFGVTTTPDRGFADGGRPPINVPSVVGERGPELFVPDAAGTIIANEKMGGSVTNNYISAMDSQDVMRALEKTKRGVSELVIGTARTYNLGTV